MIDKIKEIVFNQYSKDDRKWFFLSAFDASGNLLLSKWVVIPQNNLENTINIVYNQLSENDISNESMLVIDILETHEKIETVDALQNIDLLSEGLFLLDTDSNNSWVLLANTKWVENISHALKIIKEKNNLWSNVDVYKITTNRIQIWL